MQKPYLNKHMSILYEKNTFTPGALFLSIKLLDNHRAVKAYLQWIKRCWERVLWFLLEVEKEGGFLCRWLFDFHFSWAVVALTIAGFLLFISSFPQGISLGTFLIAINELFPSIRGSFLLLHWLYIPILKLLQLLLQLNRLIIPQVFFLFRFNFLLLVQVKFFLKLLELVEEDF